MGGISWQTLSLSLLVALACCDTVVHVVNFLDNYFVVVSVRRLEIPLFLSLQQEKGERDYQSTLEHPSPPPPPLLLLVVWPNPKARETRTKHGAK